MALVSGRIGLALAALVAAGACASPTLTEEYGEGALSNEHFDMLDSAVLQHAGAAVTVVTQKDVGVGAPGRQVQDQVTFSGVLLPPASGFLRLLWRGRITDTLRIGKGNVVGIYLAVEHHGSATPAVLLGAVVAGLSATVATGADGSNISSSTRLVIIPAAALIGALVGALVASQEERGVQIYPPLPPGAVAK